jgi:hypothetical protein
LLLSDLIVPSVVLGRTGVGHERMRTTSTRIPPSVGAAELRLLLKMGAEMRPGEIGASDLLVSSIELLLSLATPPRTTKATRWVALAKSCYPASFLALAPPGEDDAPVVRNEPETVDGRRRGSGVRADPEHALHWAFDDTRPESIAQEIDRPFYVDAPKNAARNEAPLFQVVRDDAAPQLSSAGRAVGPRRP